MLFKGVGPHLVAVVCWTLVGGIKSQCMPGLALALMVGLECASFFILHAASVHIPEYSTIRPPFTR